MLRKAIPLLTIALIVLLAVASWGRSGGVRLYLDGRLISAEGVIVGDQVYLPLRALTDEMGARLAWDPETRSVAISLPKPAATAVPSIGDAVPASSVAPVPYLALGSSESDVRRALGDPERVFTVAGCDDWWYGLSCVYLRAGRVVGWFTLNRDLHLAPGLPATQMVLAYPAPPPTLTGATGSPTTAAPAAPPLVAGNGSYYGEISKETGRPKEVHVNGYYRKDGTYVRGHYRSSPRRR